MFIRRKPFVDLFGVDFTSLYKVPWLFTNYPACGLTGANTSLEWFDKVVSIVSSSLVVSALNSRRLGLNMLVSSRRNQILFHYHGWGRRWGQKVLIYKWKIHQECIILTQWKEMQYISCMVPSGKKKKKRKTGDCKWKLRKEETWCCLAC